MEIFGFVSAKWFHWKKKKKKVCQGISPQLRPSSDGGREDGAAAESLGVLDKHLWVLHCSTDHEDMLSGGFTDAHMLFEARPHSDFQADSCI